MLTFNGNLKVHVALDPCDMRKSFNGLCALVRNHLELDPLSGAAFLLAIPGIIKFTRRIVEKQVGGQQNPTTQPIFATLIRKSHIIRHLRSLKIPSGTTFRSFC